ncbi:Alpha/Beta hydrolase protein [Lipomyces oligophaga]|uniref:Alpha/Beta hydrolase protein n=1 Tax=Lipomyces oligophaga TaxID=45792 RepID=UPI0034CF1B92
MYLPLIGRLRALEWPPLVLGLILVLAEKVLRFITGLLPSAIILACESTVKSAMEALLPPMAADTATNKAVHDVVKAPDFVSLCKLVGLEAEEHIVKTRDGYLLGIHRVRSPGAIDKPRPVVYLHHGLLMNSEVWLCAIDRKRCLPALLVDKGYDVWLGNNRGNKYSKKHLSRSPVDINFWDFSMDELALYDIPDTIDYVLSTTGEKSLAYIGFSQGSAQAFAALSLHPQLNAKVSVFVALAPAMAPPGLRAGVVDALIKASPGLIYLFFGRRAILSSAAFWQSIIYPPLFVRLIDSSLVFLFNWHGKNISAAQKVASYSHLYSFTSVKTVVHWFQIMTHRCFQMYDDDPSVRLYGQSFYRAVRFPTQNIRSPIIMIYGTVDSLVDINAMIAELPPYSVTVPIKNHEHLDLIWADDVEDVVFPHVEAAIEKYLPLHEPVDLKHTSSKNVPESPPKYAYAPPHMPPAQQKHEHLRPQRNSGSRDRGTVKHNSTTDGIIVGMADPVTAIVVPRSANATSAAAKLDAVFDDDTQVRKSAATGPADHSPNTVAGAGTSKSDRTLSTEAAYGRDMNDQHDGARTVSKITGLRVVEPIPIIASTENGDKDNSEEHPVEAKEKLKNR